MKVSKRFLLFIVLTVAITYVLTAYQLPYYIYKPGSADALEEIVDVDHGYESKGNMRLVTVSGLQATPVFYLWSKFSKYHEIVPLKEVRPEGISEEEYMQMQLQMMESSQESSVVVAYEEAGKEIEIEYNGVYVVSVIDEMPAEGKLWIGDRITGVDQEVVKEADNLTAYIDSKSAGDTVTFHVVRNEETIEIDIVLEKLDMLEDKVGIGIQLVTNRHVVVDPEVRFSSGNIGGPSAGLMFSLEIYNQLMKEDITKGYQVVGTGALDYDGNVSRIGGIDKKVIAADRAGGDIFFAPYEGGASNSNYEVAKKTADAIRTEMKIVPVDTFEEALLYLQSLEEK